MMSKLPGFDLVEMRICFHKIQHDLEWVSYNTLITPSLTMHFSWDCFFISYHQNPNRQAGIGGHRTRLWRSPPCLEQSGDTTLPLGWRTTAVHGGDEWATTRWVATGGDRFTHHSVPSHWLAARQRLSLQSKGSNSIRSDTSLIRSASLLQKTIAWYVCV